MDGELAAKTGKFGCRWYLTNSNAGLRVRRRSVNQVTVLLTICKILIVIGALNWGLVGFFKLDLVAAIFGEKSAASRFVYAIVGLAAVVYVIFWLLRLTPGQA